MKRKNIIDEKDQKIFDERAAREWSTVVDISITPPDEKDQKNIIDISIPPPSFKPVSLTLPRFPLF